MKGVNHPHSQHASSSRSKQEEELGILGTKLEVSALWPASQSRLRFGRDKYK